MQMSKKSMRRGSAYLKLVHVLEQDEALSDTGRKKNKLRRGSGTVSRTDKGDYHSGGDKGVFC